ncbi:hypothetical protein BsWGS_13404 [Bradybaena similaris]
MSDDIVSTTDRPTPDAKLKTNKPQQIHLSMGSRVNDFYVMWATEADEDCYVEYGSSSETYVKVIGTQTELEGRSYNAAKYMHRAELLNLKPGTRYSYYVVCFLSGSRTEKFTFEVPHGNPQKHHRFVVLADVGLLTRSLQFLVHEVLNGGYEVVFHIGDIAYNLGTQGGSVGDEFMNKISNFTARVPYMTTPGDHERFSDFYDYRHRFSMPNAPWPMTEGSLWYSIDIGYTHFVSINTELVPPSRLNSFQFTWLKNDLINANKNRNVTPWVIVMGHKPLYCTKSVMEQECDQDRYPLREQLEDLFFEQGVDLYISGHKHCYERSWPMYQGRVFQTDTINPMAPIHIITGATGYEYLVDKQFSHPFWLAFAASDGDKELYARLTVLNETHLVWSVHAVLTNEDVENLLVIQKHHGSFGKAGPSAFSKIRVETNKQGDLPPEPFYLVDVQTDNQSRRIVLYSVVIILSFILFAFLRSANFRKTLWLRW